VKFLKLKQWIEKNQVESLTEMTTNKTPVVSRESELSKDHEIDPGDYQEELLTRFADMVDTVTGDDKSTGEPMLPELDLESYLALVNRYSAAQPQCNASSCDNKIDCTGMEDFFDTGITNKSDDVSEEDKPLLERRRHLFKLPRSQSTSTPVHLPGGQPGFSSIKVQPVIKLDHDQQFSTKESSLVDVSGEIQNLHSSLQTTPHPVTLLGRNSDGNLPVAKYDMNQGYGLGAFPLAMIPSHGAAQNYQDGQAAYVNQQRGLDMFYQPCQQTFIPHNGGIIPPQSLNGPFVPFEAAPLAYNSTDWNSQPSILPLPQPIYPQSQLSTLPVRSQIDPYAFQPQNSWPLNASEFQFRNPAYSHQ
jgi:hypothetical protein